MTALITGSSRGIGKAIASKFNELGYNIVLNGSEDNTSLQKTFNELKANNKNVIAIQADVSNYNDVKNMFYEIESKFGNVDILINNAGISHVGLFSDMTEHEWSRIIDVNLKSVFNCCHCAVPKMVQNKHGFIVNISSIWGVNGASCEAVYSATKSAVNAFTKALGKELAPSGINVNAIACGLIDTTMNNFLSTNEKRELIGQIPSMRIGTAEEVANLCLFLATKSSSYLIGQTITLDGGFL